MTQQSAEPLSLDRARLLLGWLRAQRAVDRCLSELLAAGPAGERRVSSEIERVSELVAEATAAFQAYRQCVGQSARPAAPAVPAPQRPDVTNLCSAAMSTVSPLSR